MIKQITGGDAVGINRKFLPEIPSVRLKCRFTIAVNTLPELPDQANALMPRLNLVKFAESYEGHEDRSLKSKLCTPEESQGLLVWALDGLKRLRERGVFTEPESSIPLTRQFQALASPISEFVEDCCVMGPKVTTDKLQVYDVWRGWSYVNGLRPGTQTQLFQQLLSLYPTLRLTRRMLNGIKLQYMVGLGLTDHAKKTYLEDL
jgi:putative DNA primase/helicase